jgi:hypothetical protein
MGSRAPADPAIFSVLETEMISIPLTDQEDS